jgi:predicted amidohydrolase YtcJ
MLITRAQLEDGEVRDVRVERGLVTAIGALDPAPEEWVVAALGGLLLPGLHDHHIHAAALAASLTSVRCGPPEVSDAGGFAAALRAAPGDGWLRGAGYHESVAGMLDAPMLDAILGDRPVRVQHRSGRMWFLNSAALDILLKDQPPPPGLQRENGRFTGRLFDEDAWMKQALGGRPPSLAAVGAILARGGVTGLTDMSPANDAVMARHFADQGAAGSLPQRVLLAGRMDLTPADMAGPVQLGAAKLHLHEAELPPFDDAVDFVRTAHARGRNVAVHCATELELVFTLAAFDAVGAVAGDRIEHASIAPDTAVEEIARLGLAVVSQPHFVAERGDIYRTDVEPELQPLLYRLGAFRDAGVALAAGSDAPFGGPDPWAAMAAAVSRRTRAGAVIGESEALTPEQALDLYLRAPDALDRRRRVAVGAVADLCLIDRPWATAREALAEVKVRGAWVAGRMIFDGSGSGPA